MKRRVLVVLPVLLAAFAAEAAAQENISARARRWRTLIDGDFRADDNSLPGSSVDLRDSLDLEDEVDIDDFGAALPFPSLGRINVQYWTGSYEGDSILTQSVNFAGTTFGLGTPVETELEWQVGTFLFEYAPGGTSLLGMGGNVTMQFGAKHLRVKATMESAGGSEEFEVEGFIPVVGFRSRFGLASFLQFEIEANFLPLETYEIQGISGTMYDGSVTALATFSSLHAGLGYRWFQLDIKDDRTDVDSSEADLEIKGFFAEAGIRF